MTRNPADQTVYTSRSTWTDEHDHDAHITLTLTLNMGRAARERLDAQHLLDTVTDLLTSYHGEKQNILSPDMAVGSNLFDYEDLHSIRAEMKLPE